PVDQLGRAPIVLLPAGLPGLDLGRVSDAQLVPVPGQLALEPQHVPARLYSHFAAPRQGGIELVHLIATVTQPPLHHLPRLWVHGIHLLTTRMKITAYNP